ncbi:MAG: DUF2975 domain-containing protein [Ruminococcaceae bacterium]|nr:DUF2975 domain-containing protein [Oscillospiraceae bacterium]
MNRSTFPARVTLWINRGLALVITVLLFTLQPILDWYATYRVFDQSERIALTVSFYLCALVTYLALWQFDRLLNNVLHARVFVKENVTRLRIIRWCCAAVSLICLPAACVYIPLIFMVVIMGFLCLALTVVVQVMKAAVAIREENDLTI